MDVYVHIVREQPGPGVYICSHPVRIVLTGPAEAGSDVYNVISLGEAIGSDSGSNPIWTH